MELSEWCEQAPHGPYFQPIRLRLDGVAPDVGHTPFSLPGSPSAAAAASPAAPSTPPRNANCSTNGHINGNANGDATSPDTSTPKRLKRRQKPAITSPRLSPLSDADRDGFVLLPPFQSAHVGANRTVLNVGGPVWAMDWLPHDVYRATATASTKQKKTSGHGNKANVGRATNGTAVADESAGGGASSKDPLAEWRLLALATHPPCTVVDGTLVKNTPPDHHYDAPKGGRNLVQIWAVPVTKKSSSIIKSEPSDQADEPQQPTPRRIPRLVYAIDHDCGVAWDVHWSPLTHKMARYRQPRGLLGLLAVAFGDGSVQVFEIPLVSPDKLQPEPSEHVVERLQPIAAGKMERIIQLSVRWSPLRPNLLLTGCSDGSVALWNLDELVSKPGPKDGNQDTYEMEPQRRFQDADTVGKQEPFDWGWGWVAVRAVCWSPFDENLFATTGNDSLFKIWDIREPRICFRSHRIRSTWGLALQWMDDTSVQISGDQGSLYMYDVLSGSYQKLHFHPQIDSPVWDLQFARRGRFPILLSSCTSGSLRVAPAKKIFRAPQHSVEFCRLNGEKNANVEQPHKSLTLSFEHHIVSGSAEAASPATREFCERDASLHRVRLSTNEPGEFPCFLATGGHAGLVILMEMQDEFDNLFENYFLQPSKKIGRPRKSGVSANPWHGRQIGQEKPKKVVAPPKIKRVSGTNLSSFAKASGIVVKAKPKPKKSTKELGYPEVQVESASPSEAEYQDGESESESEELSLGDDNSDDDRVVGSDEGDESEVEIVAASPENSTAVRMRHEYQMDLSEEDAILLAIQMSEMEQATPQKPPMNAYASTNPKPSRSQDAKDQRSDNKKKGKQATGEANGQKKPKASTPPKSAEPASSKKRPETTENSPSSSVNPSSVSKAASTSKKTKVSQSSTKKQAVSSTGSAEKKWSAPKTLSDGSTPMPTIAEQPDIMYVEEMDQSTIQMHIYQQGMTEEDALREALRMSVSDMSNARRSNRKRKVPQPPSAFSASTRQTPPFQKRHKPASEPHDASTKTSSTPTLTAASAPSPGEVVRRLEFMNMPPPSSPSKGSLAAGVSSEAARAPPSESAALADKRKTARSPQKARPKSAPSKGKKAARKNADTTSSKTSVSHKQPSPKTSQSTSTTMASTKKEKSASGKKPKPKRASTGGAAGQFLTDEELLAIALQTSQIEY